jgi:hypothetical protein
VQLSSPDFFSRENRDTEHTASTAPRSLSARNAVEGSRNGDTEYNDPTTIQFLPLRSPPDFFTQENRDTVFTSSPASFHRPKQKQRNQTHTRRKPTQARRCSRNRCHPPIFVGLFALFRLLYTFERRKTNQ